MKAPALFVIWGLVYLIGYGAIWLSVRGQRPYQAPSGLALTGMLVLAMAALAVTASITSRARSGITGASGTRMFVYYMSVGAGVLAVIIVNSELAQDHASPHVLAFVGAAGPILVTGLAVSALSAVMRRWSYLAPRCVADRRGGSQRPRGSSGGVGNPVAGRLSRLPGLGCRADGAEAVMSDETRPGHSRGRPGCGSWSRWQR